jgi:serine protease
MQSSTPRSVTRAGHAMCVLVLALVAALLPPTVDAADAQELPVTRHRGANRYETAALVSQATFAPGVATVYVATGEVFPDALAGGALAGRDDAPILLVGRETIPDATASELERLDPEAIVVLGGRAAVADGVATALDAYTAGDVTRLSGANRYATAAAIAAAGFAPGPDTVIVATGEAFPDGLAGGAAAAHRGVPVLLTAGDRLPAETAAELDRLRPESITVLGGAAAVSEDVVQALDEHTAGDVRRLAGSSRYATAAAVSADTFAPGVDEVFLATGEAFPDALTGAPAAAHGDTALLLTPQACVPAPVRAEIARLDPDRLVVLGGPAAVSDDAAALRPCEDADQTLPLSFDVDPELKPAIDALPAWEPDGEPRRLARITDELGHEIDFVENELLLLTDDEDELDAFLERWDGEIVHTTKPREEGGLDMPNSYIIRVEPTRGDPATLTANVRTMDAASRGAHHVSTDGALRLIAAAAADAADGLTVGINPLFESHDFGDRQVEEAQTGEELGGIAYDKNPMEWPHLRRGGGQTIGVSEAWRALELAGKLGGDPVDIAILDGGFIVQSTDYPDDRTELSVIPGQPASGKPNLGQPDKAWHGTNVAMVATAKVGNGFGTAGTGGPVSTLITVNTTGDAGLGIFAINSAVVAGADIINMSYGIDWPASVSFLGAPFSIATSAADSLGVMVFASAGNDGEDVDAEDCFVACWEEAFWSPCENAQVICVGGLAENATGRHAGSNLGYEWCENEFCDVDIFAPYVVYLAHTGDFPGTNVRKGFGTSYASPFAAGVAALVWAADRDGLNDDDVEQILYDTAYSSPDNRVNRYVNAFAAVRHVLGGDIPPWAAIVKPDNGKTVSYGGLNGLEFEATGDDYEGQCCAWEWTSDVEGVLWKGPEFLHSFGSPGAHTITLKATDSAGQSAVRSVVVHAKNDAPTATIVLPAASEEIIQHAAYKLKGKMTDPNQLQPPCSSLTWTSSAAADQQASGGSFPLSGCQPAASFPTLGARTLTLTVTDEHGLTHSRSVTIQVVPPPEHPVVTITAPDDGAFLQPSTPVDLLADTFEPDGDEVTYEWVVVDLDDSVGTTEDVMDWVPGQSVPFSCGGRTVTLRVRATDKDGTGEDTIDVYVAHPPC